MSLPVRACSNIVEAVSFAQEFRRILRLSREKLAQLRAKVTIFHLHRMAYQEKQLTEISKYFQIYGEILHAETCKIGHINETYSATYDQGGTKRPLHPSEDKQERFQNPSAVMDNVMRVTTHLRKKLERATSAISPAAV